MPSELHLAVIGDVHRAWTAFDVGYFDEAPVDAVLFVGDLPDLNHRRAYEVAAQIAPLTKPTYVMPGNHDGVTLRQLLAELSGQRTLCRMTSRGHEARVDRLQAALGDATLCGYSHHQVADDVAIIAARPHAMGAHLTFAPYLTRRFQVQTMEESAAKLRALIETSPCSRLVFLAHNGPTGLGEASTDIWGCDFRRGGGDWGDPDLADAVAFARTSGREVLAVVAGHMHRLTKQGEARTWHVERDGVHYVNAARVPRIFRHEGQRVHHHVRLTVTNEGCAVEDILVPEET